MNTGAIENDRGQTTIRLNRRTYSPILGQASLPETIAVPWREGRADLERRAAGLAAVADRL